MASVEFRVAGVEDVNIDVLVGNVFGPTVAAIPGMLPLVSFTLIGLGECIAVGMITRNTAGVR